MAILNYTTTVPVTRTLAEVQSILARHGVREIRAQYDNGDVATGLSFSLPTDAGVRNFELPIRSAGVLEALNREAGIPAAKRRPEHAERVAWRIAKDWLEAQFALVDAGMSRVDEVLMPYMLADDGQTMYALFRSRQERIEP